MLRSYTQLHGPRRGEKVGTHPRKARMLPNPSPRKVTFAPAESPRILGQLERLRQQLSAVRSEAKILKKKLSDNELATAECARLWKANRRRVCELIEEEQEEDAEDNTSDFHTKVRVEKEALELRDEIIHLANEVKCLADLQLWRAGKLRQLKMLAKVQKAQQGVKLAQTEEKELQKLKEQQVHELQAAKDQCDVLRKRKTKLKDELISVRSDLAGPSRPSPSELLVVLRSQLRAEEHRSQIWQLIDTSREKSQEALQLQKQQLKESLKFVQESSGWTASQLQDAEQVASTMTTRLSEARKKASLLAEEVRHVAMVQDSLQAELLRQRDATRAWQSCAAEGTGALQQQRDKVTSALETCERLLRQPTPPRQAPRGEWSPGSPLPPLTLGPL